MITDRSWNRFIFSWRVFFYALVLFAAVLFLMPAKELVALALKDERYTQVAVAPLLVGGILYLERGRIFNRLSYFPSAGLVALICGVLIHLSVATGWVRSDALTLSGLALFLAIAGLFIFRAGWTAFRQAGFAFLLLLWIVPWPDSLVQTVAGRLQSASADASGALFRLLGVPAFRQGFGFLLPGVRIEVAPECSGMHSAIALLICTMLVAHLFLLSKWKMWGLVAFVIPILILKNALRIVSIALLGAYVDRGYLYGNFHRYGGIPFFLVGAAMVLPLAWLLWRSERFKRAESQLSRPA